MLYALLAQLVLVLHAAFIVFVILGGVLLFWRPGLAWLHVPCALWGVIIVLLGWVCPLTYLENRLWRAAGDRGYTGGFIDHYIEPLVYPTGLTHEVQILLGLSLLAFNVLIYTLVWRFRLKPESR